ncbi:MAG: glycosyl hydrolase [Leptolyngbyaceae cyanobacterium]
MVLSWSFVDLALSAEPHATFIKVYGAPIGVSTRYIGACEGNVDFDLADMADLGINTYRIYGGMPRWETEDDDGVYGFPTIAQIKANPHVVPWDTWDAVMTQPETGSDYGFSGLPETVWPGSARTIFETLKQAKIRPVVTIRNTNNGFQPDWALQLNPPRTEADWNEWWEHVFATVYWLNVRNDYQVDDFEIQNEPDNRQSGWGGSQADYFGVVQVAADAIAHVYSTYLPDRTFHIHAPKTTGESDWPRALLSAVPTYVDSINVHNYSQNVADYVKQVRNWMHGTIHEQSPLWLGEWGTYTGGYDDLNFSLNLIKNMMRMSQPGETYVYGNHLFSLYDWGLGDGFEGLINATGDRRLSYYAFRMGIRALQGGRPILPTASSVPGIMVMATRDNEENLYLLMVNDHSETRQIVADVSSLFDQGRGTIREFGAATKDEIVADVNVEDGDITIELPTHTSRLLILSPGGSDLQGVVSLKPLPAEHYSHV